MHLVLQSREPVRIDTEIVKLMKQGSTSNMCNPRLKGYSIRLFQFSRTSVSTIKEDPANVDGVLLFSLNLLNTQSRNPFKQSMRLGSYLRYFFLLGASHRLAIGSWNEYVRNFLEKKVVESGPHSSVTPRKTVNSLSTDSWRVSAWLSRIFWGYCGVRPWKYAYVRHKEPYWGAYTLSAP